MKITMRSEFDLVIDDRYGVIDGEYNRFVLIKSGAGGSYCGYEGKYLHLADRINKQTDATVITAGNLSNKSLLEKDIPVLNRMIRERSVGEMQLDFFGVSDGAIQALYLQKDHPIFNQMILVNPPLCLNFHRILDALKRINDPIYFVFGSNDPSASIHLELLKQKIELMGKQSQIDIIVVDGADHQFRMNMEMFLELADLIN